jgi:hypothetical protein
MTWAFSDTNGGSKFGSNSTCLFFLSRRFINDNNELAFG